VTRALWPVGLAALSAIALLILTWPSEAVSTGCARLTLPDLDSNYASSTVDLTTFDAAETVQLFFTSALIDTVSFEYPVGTVIFTGVPIPGSITYTLPAAGTDMRWRTDGGAPIDWQVTCLTPTLTVSAGNNQTAEVSAAFGSSLQLEVRDGSGNLFANGSVTLTAPAVGASAIFASSGTNTITVTTDAAGLADSGPLNANAIAGTYTVGVQFGSYSASFTLTNGASGGGSIPPAGGSGPVSVPGLDVPHLGLVMIHRTQRQPAFTDPGGAIAQDGAGQVYLPFDADGNGFDTYVVTRVVHRQEVIWLGLFLGSGVWGWVPLANVVPLTPIAGVD
jgi:hypothetical protein